MSADNNDSVNARATELIGALTLQQKHAIFVDKLHAEGRVPERLPDDYLANQEWLASIDSILLPLAKRIAKAESKTHQRYDISDNNGAFSAFNQVLALYTREMGISLTTPSP